MFEKEYFVESAVKALLEICKNKMINKDAHLRSKLKRWYSFWVTNFKTVAKT